MSIIIATEEGIEIDGVLLKDNVDLKAYIAAHAPEQVEVTIGMHKPEDLTVYIEPVLWRWVDFNAIVNCITPSEFSVLVGANETAWMEAILGITEPYQLPLYLTANQPGELRAIIDANQPEQLSVKIGKVWPEDLTVYLGAWTESYFSAILKSHLPKDLQVLLGSNEGLELSAYIAMHSPQDIIALLYPIPYHKIDVIIRPMHVYDLSAYIRGHPPSDLASYIEANAPYPLTAYINPMYTHSFKAWFFTVKQGQIDLTVYVKVTKAETLDLELLMHIWSLKTLYVTVAGHTFQELNVSTWVWTPTDIQVAIDTHFPGPLTVGVIPQPEDGIDLRIIHGFYDFTSFLVNLNVWTEFYNFRVSIWGVYTSNLEVVFRMGGSSYLEVPIPMTTGYRNLFVTCKPASRIMTTIIPVYTVEIKNLYVSINQGWPCGFGSAYKLLSVTFDSAYFHAFTATFKVIHGSGSDLVGVFINRAYFDTYINKFDIHIRIPDEVDDPETYIHDKVDIVYDNEFADLYQDIVQITFDWPRIRLLSGESSFFVELFSYHGDKEYGLTVLLYAQRQAPVRQLTSVPVTQRAGLADPIWPDVFQVHEIELWGDDPPEIIRMVEIKFEEQIHEYYWVSSEQRAVAKKVYERWAFLTRGYLPNAEYSGQIDYLTMRSLSSMKRYDTIDQAVKAMIANFLYSGQLSFDVSCIPHGGYSPLLIDMTIRDYNHLRNLNIVIEPMHVQPLTINVTPV